MNVLLVVNHPAEFPFALPGCSIVAAREYLTHEAYGNALTAQLVNLCRTDRYQGQGYYVSLLAAARGHHPLPELKTVEDLQSQAHLHILADELAELAQRTLPHEPSREIELHVYFGRDRDERHGALAQRLFQLVPAPLLCARFERKRAAWRLTALDALAAGDIAPQHHAALERAATEYVTGRRMPKSGSAEPRARIAILRDPAEPDPPSNPAALQRFTTAARQVGLEPELITAADIGRLGEFDGLFIRATTNVAHYTYEFSRRADELGMVVLDDPGSILKCTNKVYLHELMARHHVPTPKTLAIHRRNLDQVQPGLGLPCILKQPDSAFSLGVTKIESAQQLQDCAQALFERSELLIAQQWLPTEFDWRVCILDRRPLLVCRYYMAPGHWQVIKRESKRREEGSVDTLSVAEAPALVVETAVRAANLIGDGFYGVDLKQVGGQCYLIEVNDNPSIDAGNEDRVLQGALYREVMGVFARRIADNRLRARCT